MGWLASPTLPRRLCVQGTWVHCFRLKSAGKASLHTWNLVSRGERLHEEPTFPPHASQETVGFPRCSDTSPLREDVWPAPAPENATLQVQWLCPSPGFISRCPSGGTVQGTQVPPRPLLHKFLVTSRLSQPINQPSNQDFITLHPGFWELCSHPKFLKWDYPDGHRIPGLCHRKRIASNNIYEKVLSWFILVFFSYYSNGLYSKFFSYENFSSMGTCISTCGREAVCVVGRLASTFQNFLFWNDFKFREKLQIWNALYTNSTHFNIFPCCLIPSHTLCISEPCDSRLYIWCLTLQYLNVYFLRIKSLLCNHSTVLKFNKSDIDVILFYLIYSPYIPFIMCLPQWPL